jgi:hypothetical protein
VQVTTVDDARHQVARVVLCGELAVEHSVLTDAQAPPTRERSVRALLRLVVVRSESAARRVGAFASERQQESGNRDRRHATQTTDLEKPGQITEGDASLGHVALSLRISSK